MRPEADLASLVKKIKLPQGFKIEVWAPSVLQARQMAWGDKGTLFVGTFDLGNVYAITDKGGKLEVKPRAGGGTRAEVDLPLDPAALLSAPGPAARQA